MASAQPGANSRGRGGKFRKFTRGGGKHFSRDLKPVDPDGNEISMWSEDAQKQFADGSNEEDDDDSDEDSDDAGPSKVGETTREEKKNLKKARKDAAIARKKGQTVQAGDLPPSDSEEDSDDDMPANPNHSKASRQQATVTSRGADVEEVTEGVAKVAVASNRRERESAEAQLAKERYQQLHAQGKTDEAKADMARLKLIREQREAEAARRLAEKEEREAYEKAKKAEIDAKEAKKREAALGPKKSGKKAK